MKNKARWLPFVVLGAAVAIAACSSDGALQNQSNNPTSGTALTQADVDTILVQAVSQAQSRGLPAVVAVTDREGEVLGVFTMSGGLQGDFLGEGDIQTAISKASTASAFQSAQNGFTTRTAYFIVQGHYPPNVLNQPGGPLFGVQDSGFPGTEGHVVAFDSSGTPCGTGITGILGGVPLFKNGSPVGGIGVSTVAVLVTESNPAAPIPALTLATSIMKDQDELIARAGAHGFETPFMIAADQLFVGGIIFPFFGDTVPEGAPTIAASTSSIAASVGAIDPRYPVRASGLTPEVAFGSQYGIRASERYIGRVVARSSPVFSGTFTNVDRPASVTYNANLFRFENVPINSMTTVTLGGIVGDMRTPPIDGVEPPPAAGGLTKTDVQTIMAQAAYTGGNTLAAIRLPRGSTVRVHITVVDARGNILGTFRMGDGTHFSHDIAIQKARTAAFFSGDGSDGVPACAITPRAIGFVSQPFFPPGISGAAPGPLVRLRDLVNRGKITIETPPVLTLINPPPRSPSDGTTDEDPVDAGFQTFNDFLGGPAVEMASLQTGGTVPVELGAIRGAIGATGGIPIMADRPDVGFISPGIQNGIMTFPGGVPLYKNGKLVGAVGCSGDGVDEDDLMASSGAVGFLPPAGSQCDELPTLVFSEVVQARMGTLVAAIAAHPDPRIRNVYGPCMKNIQTQINLSFQQGLSQVRLPYVKFPRNPGDL